MFKKATRIKEINSENFDQAVVFTKKLRKKVVSHLRIRAIALPIGCISFLAMALFLTFGWIGATFSIYGDFISAKLPFITNLWADFFAIIEGITTAWYLQTLICFGVLFAVPFLVFSVVVAIINMLTIVPFPSKSGSHKEQVNALHEYCRQIRCSMTQDWRFHAVWSRIVTFSILVTLIAYEIYALVDGYDGTLNFVYLSIPLYFVYGLLINLFLRLTWICYRDKNEDYYSLSSSRFTYFMIVITEYKEKFEAHNKKDPKTLLIENYKKYGHGEYVQKFVKDFDKRLKNRKYEPGDYTTYDDLWEESKWLYEINHPDAKKYEAIVCYCAHTDYQCSKYEQERAFKRFCELGMSYKLADGYCRNYFVHHEETPVNPDPTGIRDGVHVDGRGI